MKELRYLNKFFIKYRGRLLLGLLITVIARIFALFIPIFIGNIVNNVKAFENATAVQMQTLTSDINFNILVIIGAALLAGAFYLSNATNNYRSFSFY